ncbi:hypothetical protein SLS62_005286 [Diatrype stigma]|uniref:Zn(2)-C6 fungal-type domain-containing protein n=1 Tax=Diatrype stigma TaxID=117547 RepID=A0AAN9YSM7_9PEZI
MATSSGSARSRQKSCNACVRSKRRCDKRAPACGRCTKKRYMCVYGGLTDMPHAAFEDATHDPIQLDSPPGPGSDTCGDAPTFDAAGFSTPLDAASLGLANSPTTTLRLDNSLESFLDTLPLVGFEDASWQSSSVLRQQFELPSAPCEQTLTLKDYAGMLDMCDDFQPWQAADPSTGIAYTLGVFKSLHETFAQNNHTPYIHHRLYTSQTPQVILQAFTVCMLYANRTNANRGIILRVLHDHVTRLRASSRVTALTPLEKLARVHALIFYQTIRLFDGDISLGQQAQNDFKLLEAWIGDLLNLRDNLSNCEYLDTPAIRNNPPQSWERWVFAESLRRTVVIGYALESLSEVLRGMNKQKAMGNWALVHRWTLSSHLWNAPDSFEFFQAWGAKPFWVISAFKFEEFVKTGTADDIDDFARWFLTM